MPAPTSPPASLPSAHGGIRSFGTWGAGEGQPDWTMSIDGRGLLEGTYKKHHPSNYGIGGAAPNKGTPHAQDGRLKCYKSSATFDKMGRCWVTASYIGISKDPTETEWEISSTTSSESIVLHPDLGNWVGIINPATAKNPNWSWNRDLVETDTGNSQSFVRFKITAPNGFGGVESYLAPRGTIKASFYTGNKSKVREVLANIGKYAPQPKGVPSEVCAQNGSNYLLTSAGISEYGTIFKVQTEWMQSAHGEPWNTYIYKAYGSGNGGGSSAGINRIGGNKYGYASFNPIGGTNFGSAPFNSIISSI